jgi:anti-sigma factor RsiW
MSAPGWSFSETVSAERDELRRLIEELSDDRVPAVLAEARRQRGQARGYVAAAVVRLVRQWPV